MILYIMYIKSVISKEVHFSIFKNIFIVLFIKLPSLQGNKNLGILFIRVAVPEQGIIPTMSLNI